MTRRIQMCVVPGEAVEGFESLRVLVERSVAKEGICDSIMGGVGEYFVKMGFERDS